MDQAGFLPVMAAIMIFLSLVFLFMSIYLYLRRFYKRRKMIGRIGSGEAKLSKVGELVGADKNADPKGTRLAFLRAGIRNEKVQVAFMGAKYLGAIVLPVLFLISRMRFFLAAVSKPSAIVLLSVLLMIAGYYAPNLWLRMKTNRRKEQIRDSLPDALDLLVVCVEAGMGLDAAIHRVAEAIRGSSPALSDEFKLFNLEVRAGTAKREALKNIAMRTDIEDVNSLIAIMIQTEKLGTSIAQALRVYSDTFRTKRTQRAEEIAAKLPAKILVPLVFFIVPAIFIAIIGPGVIRIFHTIVNLTAK